MYEQDRVNLFEIRDRNLKLRENIFEAAKSDNGSMPRLEVGEEYVVNAKTPLYFRKEHHSAQLFIKQLPELFGQGQSEAGIRLLGDDESGVVNRDISICEDGFLKISNSDNDELDGMEILDLERTVIFIKMFTNLDNMKKIVSKAGFNIDLGLKKSLEKTDKMLTNIRRGSIATVAAGVAVLAVFTYQSCADDNQNHPTPVRHIK